MTAEQEKQIAEIRAVDYHETSGVGKLLAIIDDLQKQQPKRYTKAELYKIWRDAPESETGESKESWDGALWLARFLGMIKTEGGIMNESEQAITDEIESAKMSGDNKRVIDLLESLVGSQAQKIADLTKERDAAREYGVYMRGTVNGLKSNESIHIGAMPWENQ